ncbi:MAG TPA: hypothetical protein VK399_17290 [Longimicrobiaceae bacterium]|nr:hypothetical protein [Longimicrobiaceae bacterium]
MSKRSALAGLFLSTLLIAAGYASAFLPGDPPRWAPWALAMGTAAILVASMALGAMRRGGVGRLAVPFALVFLILAGGFGAALAMPGADAADATLWLGLPPRAAIVLYGIGLLPLLFLPLAYALTFDEMTLSEADLARVRDAARALAPTAAAPVEPAPAPAASAEVEVAR